MNKKSILIISRAFYPVNSPRSFRTTELAKELARQGHKVTVLIPKREEHGAFEKKHNLIIHDLGQPKWKEIKLNGKGIPLLLKRALRRVLQITLDYPNLEFYFKVKNTLKKNAKGNEPFDLLISIAVPYSIHWGVAAVWNKKNNIAKTWVADCGDPFMGRENDTFKPPFYFKYVEKWFCKKTDFLTIPVKTAVSAYYPEFHSKIRIISQGFNFDEIDLAPYRAYDIPHFAYAGGFIQGRRDPKVFFEFLINYPHPYKFDIYTKQGDFVRRYAERSDGRIKVKPYMPRKELLYELSKLDFLVNFENAGERQIPSKIIDYVITKRPILSINSFRLDERQIEEFLTGNYNNQLKIDDPNQYRIENVANEFLKLVKN